MLARQILRLRCDELHALRRVEDNLVGAELCHVIAEAIHRERRIAVEAVAARDVAACHPSHLEAHHLAVPAAVDAAHEQPAGLVGQPVVGVSDDLGVGGTVEAQHGARR